MSANIRKLMQDSINAGYNPSSQYRASLRTLTDVLEGKIDTISAANPVIYAIENQATLVASFIETLKAETKKALQVFATDPTDLYNHMADIHFRDVFAIPSSTTFTLLFNKVELLSNLVPVPGTASKKITIPRDTYFTAGDHIFGIHYPIDIIEQEHGGIRIAYDTTIKNHLDILSTNILKHKFLKRDDIIYLAIEIPVYQFEIDSKLPVVTKGNIFKHKVSYKDEFYAIKAYRTDNLGNQIETKITYSEEVYDVLTPTILVKFLNKELEISVPQVYINTDMIVGEIRLDIYTTKGPLNISFDTYPIGSLGYKFRDIRKNADTTYSSMLNKFSTVVVLPEEKVTGGALALSFNELKRIVIDDAIGDPNIPITPAQIRNKLNRKGYDISKNIDLVTDRVFLASRDMPVPKNENLLTNASASIEHLTSTFTELASSQFVIDNGNAVTIKSDALYKIDNGILGLVKDSEITSMSNMPPDVFARYVSDRRFRYSPFHYVYRLENDYLTANAFYMESPKVLSQTFVEDNETSLLLVNTENYLIEKISDGYKLTISLKTNDLYKQLTTPQIKLVLGFRSKTEPTYSWTLGNYVGMTGNNERIYEFEFKTKFNMNRDNQIDFSNYFMFDTTPITTYSDLSNRFTLIHCVDTTFPSSYVQSPITFKLPIFLTGVNFTAICEEEFEIEFGKNLDNLWTKSRTITSSMQYETYATDTILRYTQDVYKKDPITGSEVLFDSNGNPYTEILHKKNDPILDSSGNQQVQYPAGSFKYDTNGNLIPKRDRYLKHRVDIFLIDGVYILSNDPIANEYKYQMAETLATWITKDLKEIQLQTLDKTNVYFYPKTISGNIQVSLSDGLDRVIASEQRFDIELYITSIVNNDNNLKEQLRKRTILFISDYLKNKTLSNSEIIESLRDIYKDDVVDVQVSLFGVNQDIAVMHLFDDTSKCGLKKILKLREDGIMIVKEDINIIFRTI